MNKTAMAIISLSIACVCSQAAHGEPASSAKRSVAMVGLTLPVAPHTVPRPAVPLKPVTKTLLQQKARSAYPRTHFEKAQYFKSKGNIDAALVEFLKATQENPRLVRAFYEQALIFQRKGILKLAESSLEQALAVKSDYQDARILLATVRIQQGNVGGAVLELSKSLGLDLSGKPSTTGNTRVAPARAAAAKKGNDDFLAKAPAVLQSLHSVLAELPVMIVTTAHPPHGQSSATNGATTSPESNQGLTKRIEHDKAQAQSARAKEKPDEQKSLAAKAAADEKDKDKDDNVLVLRIPKSFKFFWHKQPAPEADGEGKDAGSPKPQTQSKPKQQQEKISKASAHAQAEESPAPQKKSQPRSWLARFLHQDDAPESAQKEPDTAVYPPPQSAHSAGGESKAKGWQASRAEAQADESRAAEAPQSPATSKVRAQGEASAIALEPQTAPADEQQETGRKARVSLKFQPADQAEAPAPPSNHPFQVPQLATAGSNLLSPLRLAEQSTAAATEPEDDWTKRLRYLEENGTASLKDGEAFMFAEDTGEATLFLADGQTIKRKIAEARDAQEVVRERRPDILIPDELVYNLSLLGKLMPKFTDNSSQSTAGQAASETQPLGQPSPNFSADNLMGDSQGFWGWLKHVFKL